MRRRWRVLIGVAVVFAALLAINTVVVDSETRAAGVTADGAEILELSTVDLQVLDMPAQTERAGAEGAPIVLLHGYATSLHWFEQLAPLLNQRHRVISIDLIGHGGSAKPKSGYTIPEQAAAVAEALSSLGVEGAVVVGHSMGGYVAAELAAQASQLVDRVAVLGTPATDDGSSLPFLATLTYAPVVGEGLWRLRFPGLVKDEYQSAFAPGFDMEAAFANPDQVVEDNDAMTFSSYDRAGAGARDFIEAAPMVTRINAAAIPFLAVLGAEDEIVDTELAAEQYEAITGAEIRIFDGVGHSPHLEAPADTAELLLRFAGGAPKPVAPDPATRGKKPAEGNGQRGQVDKEAVADALGEGKADRAKQRKKKKSKKKQRSGGNGSGGGKSSGN